ncbi:MscL family protein [Streptomyces sp. NPDC056600]|uniref:large conductance mechanosensitive channel protein MscL n=1 Tax=Streptomyces sp. NPDC056600 TaxID=3345874 RepID=UPI0036CD4417
MIKGFKSFLTRADVVVAAIGLIVALAFSTLVKAFTDSVVDPVVARFQGGASMGLGLQLGDEGNQATYVDLGAFISALIYFLIFMAVVYLVIVVPYRKVQARRGLEVFADEKPVKTCPACLQEDIPEGASKCRYCGTEQLPVRVG